MTNQSHNIAGNCFLVFNNWKESLAIKLGIEAFMVYLLGRYFTIQMDHRSLVWLNKLKETDLLAGV